MEGHRMCGLAMVIGLGSTKGAGRPRDGALPTSLGWIVPNDRTADMTPVRVRMTILALVASGFSRSVGYFFVQ